MHFTAQYKINHNITLKMCSYSTCLISGSPLAAPAVPDLTSILNRRGAMMAMTGNGLRNARHINPAVLANLDRIGVVDASDLTIHGMMALGSML